MSAAFEYSRDNPPPVEVVTSKIYAVHATSYFPSSGILKAGAMDISHGQKFNGDEPPSFRPTLHFSLGELVRGHGNYGWEDNPYAVVTPLKCLEQQLINLFAHDTFILGNLHLTPEMTLLVPKKTKVSKGLSEKVSVKEYSSNIRKAIDAVVSEKGGWNIRMNDGDVGIESPAYISETEINNVQFFQRVFEAHPDVSFGTHTGSERGEAYLFGVIEQAINSLMKNYSPHWFTLATPEVLLFKEIVIYNIKKLEEHLKRLNLPRHTYQVFEEKKTKLADWLNIVDADLNLRVHFDKTFSRSTEEVEEILIKKRKSPQDLKDLAYKLRGTLPRVSKTPVLGGGYLGFFFKGMSVQEINKFINSNPACFEGLDLGEFFVNYSLSRWIQIGTQNAKAEGLDSVLEMYLKKLKKPKETLSNDPIFSDIKSYLSNQSNKLGTSLDILNQDYVRNFLKENYKIKLPRKISCLTEVLKAHSKTKCLFKPKKSRRNKAQRKVRELVQKLTPHCRRRHSEDALDSFNNAAYAGFEMLWTERSIKRFSRDIYQPINSARDPEDIIPGEELRLYELLKRDNRTASNIWAKLGLKEEFVSEFQNEEDFWRSESSFMDIYEALMNKKEKLEVQNAS